MIRIVLVMNCITAFAVVGLTAFGLISPIFGLAGIMCLAISTFAIVE